MPKYSMNLDEQYVEHWGTWEVVRELVCNAMDADPDYILKTPSPDSMEIITSTIPTMEELMIIGAGTSRQDKDKIGQFGEGFKMAALVATRNNFPLTCLTPFGRLTFSLVKPSPSYPSRVLYAHLDKRYKAENCKVTVSMPGIADLVRYKFLATSSVMLINKPEPSTCDIYVKGVFISTLEDESVFDWNLNTPSINRDRSMVDQGAAKREIGRLLYQSKLFDQDTYDQIIKYPESVEIQSSKYVFSINIAPGKMVKEAFHRYYGDMAVIATDDQRTNELAHWKGHLPVHIADDLKSAGIKTARDVTTFNDKFKEIEVPQKYYDEVNWVMDTLEVPAEAKFFYDPDSDRMGATVIQGRKATLWINKDLTKPGQRINRLATIIHEICHVSSRATDGSLFFEYKQNEMAAKVLDKLYALTRR